MYRKSYSVEAFIAALNTLGFMAETTHPVLLAQVLLAEPSCELTTAQRELLIEALSLFFRDEGAAEILNENIARLNGIESETG